MPVWISTLVFPSRFALIALRLVWRASPHWVGRAIAALGIVAGYWLAAHHYELLRGPARCWPWLVALLVAGVLGAPIFALLGGIAMFGFFTDGSRPIVPLIKAYEELTSPSANLAAIPLFTLTGFLLAEGKSSERLLRALRALFGWAPGGTAVAAATLCAFFTLFTGGSGVTILALGGLLLPALLKEGYPRALLDRPAHRIRLARPAVSALGAADPLRHRRAERRHRGPVHRRPAARPADARPLAGARRPRGDSQSAPGASPFRIGEALAALWEAKWELLLPVVVLTRCSAATRRRRSRRRSRRCMR